MIPAAAVRMSLLFHSSDNENHVRAICQTTYRIINRMVRHVPQKTAIVVLTRYRSLKVKIIIANTSKEKKNWQIPLKMANHLGCTPSLHAFTR